jgi:hypothetical protein
MNAPGRTMLQAVESLVASARTVHGKSRLATLANQFKAHRQHLASPHTENISQRVDGRTVETKCIAYMPTTVHTLLESVEYGLRNASRSMSLERYSSRKRPLKSGTILSSITSAYVPSSTYHYRRAKADPSHAYLHRKPKYRNLASGPAPEF